jgi:hypothetical protein
MTKDELRKAKTIRHKEYLKELQGRGFKQFNAYLPAECMPILKQWLRMWKAINSHYYKR